MGWNARGDNREAVLRRQIAGGDVVEDVLEKDFIEQEESFFAELFDPGNPSAMKVLSSPSEPVVRMLTHSCLLLLLSALGAVSEY